MAPKTQALFAHPEQHTADNRERTDGIASRHGRQHAERLRERQSAGDPERRLEHAEEAPEPALANNFVDGGDRARGAALDRKAHDAGAECSDREGKARQYDSHGHVGLRRRVWR